MSNQACLFAEDTPTPFDPFGEEGAPGANTVQIAGAAYQLPAFWLSCFDKDDIAVIESEEGDLPALVSELARVRARLGERGALVKGLFPAHAAAWNEFRRAVGGVGRKYLKVDAYEIWLLYEGGEFGRLLKKALNWFRSGKKADLSALLSLAGIEAYDSKSMNFSADEYDPECYLYAWLEE
jgi:hypothetical protein